MTSMLDTRYDRTTTQLLRDALERSHEDARSIGLGLGLSVDGRHNSADPEGRVRVFDDRSRHDLAVASSHLADMYSNLSSLMRAGLVLSWLRDTATTGKPAVAVEQEWEREEDWQRLFM